jgi:hypothetical protein
MHKHNHIADHRLFQRKSTVGTFTARCDPTDSSEYDDHHVSWLGSLAQVRSKQTCSDLSDPHEFLSMKSEVLLNEKQSQPNDTFRPFQEEPTTYNRKVHGFQN